MHSFFFLFCIFMGNVTPMFAQNFNECGTSDVPNHIANGGYTQTVDPGAVTSSEPKVYNVYFWGVNDDDGNNPTPLTEEIVLTATANLNLAFNKLKVFFKYRGFEHFNSSVHDTVSSGSSLYTYAAANGYKKTDAFNIYVPQHMTSYSGVAVKNKTTSVVRFEALLKPITVHEVGHNLNLEHTFRNYNSSSSCERVTRDLNDQYYNADEAGDFVIDTPAQDPMWGDVDPNTCFYTGNGEDCGDPPTNDPPDPYQILPDDVSNFMGYGGLRLCGSKFTWGQMQRMRAAISNDVYGEFAAAETTIAALYEPYRGSYPEYYPHPLPWEYPLFQPGFDYDFVECDCECPQPVEWDNTNFNYTTTSVLSFSRYETNYASIIHPNHTAIKLGQLPNHVLVGQKIRRCYDNWNSPPIIGGDVVKFNDNIFNNNVTITPQDSTQINNPNLVNELEPGLYNIIKTDVNGNNQETVILKENN